MAEANWLVTHPAALIDWMGREKERHVVISKSKHRHGEELKRHGGSVCCMNAIFTTAESLEQHVVCGCLASPCWCYCGRSITCRALLVLPTPVFSGLYL